MVMELQISTNRTGNRVVVAPQGEIDLSTNDTFRKAIDEAFINGPADLVIDLNGVTFIDSTGLGALIGARRRAHAFRGSLVVVCDTHVVLRVLRITGLDRVFTIVPSLAEAGTVDRPTEPAP
jgi:anti-sigma B factor antagonist